MEHNLNRKFFFNLLKKLNLPCTIYDYKNIYFEYIPKFNALIKEIDLDAYSLDYIQNRFIIIKQKSIPLEEITQIIFCPFDTKHNVQPTKCEKVVYEYDTKARNSYLTKPRKDNDRKTFETSTKQKDCIKGCMEPGLLNAIAVYMLNNSLISPTTMIVFGLKNYDSKWTSIDVLEYLQKHNLQKNCCKLKSIIDMDFTSSPKGLPNKDFTGRIEIGTKRIPTLMDYINSITQIEKEEVKEDLNYTLKVNRNLMLLYDQDFQYHKELSNYYNIDILSKFRLNVFTDVPPTNKFSTFFMEKPFLVEWDSINKYINLLMLFNKV